MTWWGVGVLLVSGGLIGWAGATWYWAHRVAELARLINGGGRHRDPH